MAVETDANQMKGDLASDRGCARILSCWSRLTIALPTAGPIALFTECPRTLPSTFAMRPRPITRFI
jgi:hypothetical protein